MNRILKSRTLSEMFYNAKTKYANHPAQIFRNSDNKWTVITFEQLFENSMRMVSSLKEIGVKKGSHVLVYSDNRYEWLTSNIALMTIGAVDVPRAKSAPEKELRFIAEHSDAEFAILENESLFQFIGPKIPKDKVITFDKSPNFKSFEDMLKGKVYKYDNTDVNPEDLSTIIYTSGTTGNPKGVMLTHGNFMHNVEFITPLIRFKPKITDGDRSLSILPVWHVFERTYEYVCIAGGCETCYTDVKHFGQDLKDMKPTVMAAVPRVWEHVYRRVIDTMRSASLIKRFIFFMFLLAREKMLWSWRTIINRDTLVYKLNFISETLKILYSLAMLILLFIPGMIGYIVLKPIRASLGGKLRGAFTGGGAMPKYIDNFFNSVGIALLNAYGMTECSPGISSRKFDWNFLYTVGIPFGKTSIKVLDDNGNPVANGIKGIIFVKGPQVMKGYYKNETATSAVLSKDGWLNTGDVGTFTSRGNLIILGRVKDTIVLLGGENVEPTPIEEKLEESEFITHAVVVGDDEKDLGALLVLEEERIRKLFEEWGEDYKNFGEARKNNKLKVFVREQIEKYVNSSKDFHPFEKIKNFRVLPEEFKIGAELTDSLKKKRNVIKDKYENDIKDMYKK